MMPIPAKIRSEDLEFTGARISSNSVFDDDVWLLDVRPTARRRAKIDWRISLGAHRCLTDPQFKTWLWSCKALLYLMQTGDYGLYRKARVATLVLSAANLKRLVRWMASKGIFGFDELTLEHIRSYATLFNSPDMKNGATDSSTFGGSVQLSESHRRNVLQPLRVLLALRDKIPYQPRGSRDEIADLLFVPKAISGEGTTERIPDNIALPLFRTALHWLSEYREMLVAIYSTIAEAERSSKAKHGGSRAWTARYRLQKTLTGECSITVGKRSLDTKGMKLNEVSDLVVQLETACFIVLAGMVGARVSEIGALCKGCLESVPTTRGENLLLLNGRIFKTSASEDGTPWKWVAGWDGPENPVRLAIETLESLRAVETYKSEWLFLGRWGRRDGSATPLKGGDHNKRLNVFRVANDIGDWQLASHQFRKTFARFVTKRDYTGLAALKNHFGHISRQMTEFYGFWDTDLLREVLDADVEQDFEALDMALGASVLGGQMGEKIVARNERFRGIAGEDARKIEIDSLRNELSDDPLIVMRNDYGYCIFIEDQAACGGARWKVGVATCVACPNCIIGSEHVPWWKREAESQRETIDLVTFGLLSPESQAGVRSSLKTCENIIARFENVQHA